MEDGKDESSLEDNTNFTQTILDSDLNHVIGDVGSVDIKANPTVSPCTKKGFGLKKWRRIRRDFPKEGPTSVDSSKVLKRGLSNPVEPTKARDPVIDIKQMREGVFTRASTSDSRLAVATDSENSEDRSSKSSTAASAPKMMFNSPVFIGSTTRDKHKVKGANGKSSGSSVQRSQLPKGKTETSKKFRGERVKVDKDASYSSVESDLRTSNAAFADIRSFSGIVNGIHRDTSLNDDGENSCEAQASDQQSNEEVHTPYSKHNGGEAEYVSEDDEDVEVSWEAKEEESDDQRPSTGWDPLAESIVSLKDVQAALEREIQKFGEIGKEQILLPGDSACSLGLTDELVDSEINQANSSDKFPFGPRETGSLPQEAQFIKISQKVHLLERKLEESLSMLAIKEARVVELENTLNIRQLSKGESGNTSQSLQDRREIEIELEELFKQKIEAEVECLAMRRTSQKLKVASEDQVALFEVKKSLIGEQNQVLHNLIDEKHDVRVLKEHKDQLGSSGGTLEVLKMHNRVYKHAFFLFLQLILLFLVFALFVLQLLPHSAVVVPT